MAWAWVSGITDVYDVAPVCSFPDAPGDAVADAVWTDPATRTQWAETVLHRLRHEGGAI